MEKMNGVKRQYFKEGELKSIEIYNNGKRVGNQYLYHKNGQVSSIVPFYKGKICGRVCHYDENGCLSEISHYSRNKLHGSFRQYYESGELKIQRYYFYGKKCGLYKEFFESGELKVKVRFNKKGEKSGDLFIYHSNGNLKLLQQFVNDKRHGKHYKYYPDGTTQVFRFYKEGMLNGYERKYDSEGRLVFCGIYENNKRNGIFQKFCYKDDFVYMKEAFYVDNCIQRQIETKDGILENYLTFFNGRLHGIQNLNISKNLQVEYYQYGSLFLKEGEKQEDCCVCYEETRFETKCKHPVCLKCIQKIKKNCPLCRTSFF